MEVISETINISWHVNDILLRAKEQDLDLSKEKALEVLHDLKDNHDSTIGINWEVIDEHLYLATRGEYINDEELSSTTQD